MKKVLKNLGIFIIIFISILPIILQKSISNLDEIWNYNTARAIAEGLIPYKEVSMITTPFMHVLNAIILTVFSNHLITMRIIAVTISSLILFFALKIFMKLSISKKVSVLAIFVIWYLHKDYFCIDYNYFTLFLLLIITYFELNRKNETRKYNLLIGILCGICILTKQTTGVLISGALVLYKTIILIYKKINKRDNIKIDTRLLVFRILGIIISGIVFLVYLFATNSFNDFIGYCVKGITTFSNKKSYIDLILNDENYMISILAVLVPISWILMFIKLVKHKDENVLLILLISLAEFIVVYPIADNIHFLIASLPSVIGIVYLVNCEIENIEFSKKQQFVFETICETGEIAIIVLILLSSFNKIMFDDDKEKYYSELNHFYGIEISEDLENTIKEVDEYIGKSDSKVYILNADAALYMIPLDRYNKNYDMFLNGNIGADGEEGQIENIKKEKAKYLIVKDGISRNWQNPENVRTYIKENLYKTGEIGYFDIYEN